MKLLLHYLKYDFLRWRWLVVALWALVALHCGLFAVLEAYVSPEGGTEYESWWRLVERGTPFVAHVALGWALLVLLVVAGSDSPVRRRTWLMTRAGARGPRVAARLAFVFAALVLPVAAGYAAMPWLAGFSAGTVLHSFWLALKVAGLAALVLWLWLRAWPHAGGLMLGAALSGSMWLAAWYFRMELWPEWFALPPDLIVVTVGAALPALVCLRGAGRGAQQSFWRSCVAALLLLPLGVAACMGSHWLRAAFPGPLERAVSTGADDEWVLRTISQETDKEQCFTAEGFHFPPRSDGEPAVQDLRIIASSWRRRDGGEWSAWKPAYGSIYRERRRTDLSVSWFPSDISGLSGEEHLEVRLKVLATLQASEVIQGSQGDHIKARGHGWVYERYLFASERRIQERARVVPGLGIKRLRALSGPHHAEAWHPPGRWQGQLVQSLPGRDYSNRRWDDTTLTRELNEYEQATGVPVKFAIIREEQCVRVVRVAALRKFFPDPIPEPITAPPRDPSPRPSLRQPDVEPFRGHASSVVWPARTTMPVPALDAPAPEAAYFMHWLKHQRKLPEPERMPAFVAKWWRQGVEIAVLEELPPESALLRALVAGLPEEQHGEIVSRLRAAPWLASVVAARGWLAEAKPIVLDLVRRAKRISRDLLPLCRAFRDPVFHEWMRKDFEMDVPTVLYWESMPDLALELPPLLARAQRDGWRTFKQFQALLTGGQSEMLTRLLRDVNSGGPEITWGAGYLELSVLDAAGNPPPPTGLERSPDGQFRGYNQPPVSPEFRQWCAGLTADDFTFDRSKRRFVRKPSTPPPP